MIRITGMIIVTITFMLCLTCLVLSGMAFADRGVDYGDEFHNRLNQIITDICVDNGDGTVTDNGTGLMWQKATVGPVSWDDAMSYASGLSLGGHSGWRLPNMDELLGLYNSPCTNVMEVVRRSYWSSTHNTEWTDSTYLVCFSSGMVIGANPSNSYYVRAMRSAQ